MKDIRSGRCFPGERISGGGAQCLHPSAQRDVWDTEDVRAAIKLFKRDIQINTPTHVCASCNRLQWKRSGKKLNMEDYTVFRKCQICSSSKQTGHRN